MYPPELLSGIAHLADRNADRVAEFLLGTRRFTNPICLPPAVILELSAVMQLRFWEHIGLLKNIKTNLPTTRQAARDMAQRIRMKKAVFAGPNSTPLLILVLSAWITNFAWQGLELLQADIVLANSDDDEKEFAEMFADFIWNARQSISSTVTTESN